MKATTKQAVGRVALDALMYLLGSIIYALGVIVFLAPNAIAPGGFVGIATIFNYEFPQIDIGLMTFVLNVPLLALAWWRLGRAFTIRTGIVTALSSVVMEVLENAFGDIRYIATDSGEHILAALFGGAVMGFGIGLVFSRGATTGGSEVVARLIERHLPHIPVGRLLLGVDVLIVLASVVVFGEVQVGLYATITIYVSTRVIDTIMYGGDAGRMLLIMSGHEQEIADAIVKDLDRGVTMLKAAGGYTGKDRQVLLCAVRPSEVYQLRRLVKSIDPHAFTIVVATEHTFGEGFVENE